MGLLNHLARGAVIFVFLYFWVFLLIIFGVDFSVMLFKPFGVLIVFCLAFGYSFYFSL